MSLKHLFWLISIALSLLFSALAVAIVSAEWGIYQRSAHSAEALRLVRLASMAMEKISVERGPANAAMGGTGQELPALRKKLDLARQQSDQSLAVLLAALQTQSHLSYVIPIINRVDTVSTALSSARRQVDGQIGLPNTKRAAQQVNAAVDGAVDLIPSLAMVVSDLSAIPIQSDPALVDGLIAIRIISSLREYCGQLGSRFTASLIFQQPLSKEEVIEIGALDGRVEQLRDLLELQMHSHHGNPELNAALAEVDSEYFGKARPFLNQLLQVGLVSGKYGLTEPQFVAKYVPHLQTIVRLRDVVLAKLLSAAQERHRQARMRLISVLLLVLLASGLLTYLLYLVRQRVLRPVLQVTDAVVGLAADDIETVIPQALHQDEIGDMLRALDILKTHCLERISRASSRESLIDQLQISSNTDFLTGVLNRRAFFSYAQEQLLAANRYGHKLALILLDIDHFKSINDDYGHLAGDRVLRVVAQMILKSLRKMDVLARYGGEEFVILIPDVDIERAVLIAEKLRMTLNAQSILVEDGREISVTASFGVSMLNGQTDLNEIIRHADDALYEAKHNGRNQVWCQPQVAARQTEVSAPD